MYSLNKQSRLVTVSAETKLTELKKQLAEEGLYLGYYPLDDVGYSLGYYLHRRIINLYHHKYGCLADQVSSMLVELKDGKSFHLKDAPRSAIGPDFNRMIIGSKDQLGTIKTVTLRVVSLPEKVLYGLVLIDSRDEARLILRNMVGRHMPPLFCKYLESEAVSDLLGKLHFERKGEPAAMAFCLSGLQEILSVEE